MMDLSKFIELFNLEIEKKKSFIIFLITGNKPLASEIILSETVKNQILKLNNEYKRSKIFDVLGKNEEGVIFFKINKRKSSNKYIYYDVCLFLKKNENNLYFFKNVYEDINEELSEIIVKDIVFLKLEDELEKNEIINNKFVKIESLSSNINLIEDFGFDWLYKKSFFKKLNYYNSLKSFSYSKKELALLCPDTNNYLSENFVLFSSSRSDNDIFTNNKNIKFYGNSESFLNFYDQNSDGYHLAKLNIGESKFSDAIQKLDEICSTKNLINNSNFSEFNFCIQSGIILL